MRVIRRFARQVAERFHPDKIILFGSHAYGKTARRQRRRYLGRHASSEPSGVQNPVRSADPIPDGVDRSEAAKCGLKVARTRVILLAP
jgi:hypothetical protein